MPGILETLRDRARLRARTTQNEDRLVSGTVIRNVQPRVLVNLGSHSLECENSLAQALRPGDRVRVAMGRGVSVVIAFVGRDKGML